MVKEVIVQGQKRVLNARRSLPDSRDFFLPRKGFGFAHVPKADIGPHGPPIYDQGSKGSCTAHGWMRAFETIQILNEAKHLPIEQDPFQYDGGYDPGSRRFLYMMETVVEGTPGQDNGAQIITGGKVISNYGIPLETSWPYDPDSADFFTEPPSHVLAEATQHMGKNYYRLQDLSQIKQSILEGFPVVCGLSLYGSFMTENMASTGKGVLPSSYERYEGGHCVSIVGFDDFAQELKFANSWGTSWGNKGFFTLPYSYAQSPNLFFDPMTLRPAR